MADYSRTYIEHNWTDDAAPSLNAANLNENDDFIAELDERTKDLDIRLKSRAGGGGSVDVIDSLDSTRTDAALSANMGRVLNEDINDTWQKAIDADSRAADAQIKANENEERIIVIESEIGDISSGLDNINTALQAL